MSNATFPPQRAKTIIQGWKPRERRVYDICELREPDNLGIRYHGFANYRHDGELFFTLMGATSLDGIWYDLWMPEDMIKQFMAQTQSKEVTK